MAQARTVILDYSTSMRTTSDGLRNRLLGNVTNFSQDPVLNVHVYFEGVIDEGLGDAPKRGEVTVTYSPVLPPAGREEFDSEVGTEHLIPDEITEVLPVVALVVEFVDVAGRRWRRGHGGLERLAAP